LNSSSLAQNSIMFECSIVSPVTPLLFYQNPQSKTLTISIPSSSTLQNKRPTKSSNIYR
jgi:hypothetical protein